LIANPADDEAFLRVINVPRRGLGDASVSVLTRWAGTWGKPLLELAGQADRVPDLRPNLRDTFQSFAGMIERLRTEFGPSDPATVLQQVIRAVGYEAYLADEGAEGVERLDNVAELVAGAAAWAEVAGEGGGEGEDEGAGGTPLERYLTQAALVTPADTTAGAGVTLLTVHTAKGLEWPIVALAGLEEGLFPLGRAANVEGGVEEERRLCYVGLTRAREKLYLSWARMRFRYGRLEMGEPSRFLEAVPARVVTERGTSARWDGAPARRSGRAARAAVDADDAWPEAESQDAPRYTSGERVRHRKFGGGVVRTVSGRGRDLKVTVEFDDALVGTKQLLVAYAGLEREWESA
jgi:DNA helicase-2/ATP-dependent DNA helicase PcrA